MKEGMEFASKVIKKSKRIVDRMDRSESSVMDLIVAASAESDTGTMSGRVPGWHESYYGFRRGRSTMDAVNRLREMSRAVVSWGGVALAVSSNIVRSMPYPGTG